MKNYIEYIAENLEKSIDYSEYIAENLDKNIEYAEYIAEHVDKTMNYYNSVKTNKSEMKRKERERKLNRIFKKEY